MTIKYIAEIGWNFMGDTRLAEQMIADAKAAAFIELTSNGKNEWGAGMDGNTVKASFQAILSGLNKLIT